ncbi:MAG: hypothetical protein ABI721_03810 [Candidatus Dojkabacteria bacterium]
MSFTIKGQKGKNMRRVLVTMGLFLVSGYLLFSTGLARDLLAPLVQEGVVETTENSFVVPEGWVCIPLYNFTAVGTEYALEGWPQPYEENVDVVFTTGLEVFYTQTCSEGQPEDLAGVWLPDDPAALNYLGE